ncbi:major facilitator superfamily transporter [Drechmeria coniospora]|uniref:Major facilitator superfamily transporter n=1 Tax=Drechmeria coniospora TaxID=98403 RepID=A0A151GN88_DRECN|nr:major facilitator superfamily transporter [Drechmeria coniospora]KYK58501.1 major facilitator superfamily transporter [Drechmeria coniospora]
MATTASDGSDVEVAAKLHDADNEWEQHPSNPLNWPAWKKALQICYISSMAFTSSVATSIMSPARAQLMDEFDVDSTTALVPLVMYVFALATGPVVAGPASETFGRRPIYLYGMPLGALFTLGAGLTHNFPALCFLRFMAGFCWAPLLSVMAATIQETFRLQSRGPASAVAILWPFLGPAFGPVIGSFIVHRKGWRWTQYCLIFFAVFCIVQSPFNGETFAPILRRRLAKKRGEKVPPQDPLLARLAAFAQVGLTRPLHMLFTEPIVTFLSLYVAVNFGILFSFFAGVPYTFQLVYRFSLEQSGLIFLSIAVGCVIGLVTIILCDVAIYRKKAVKLPEHRLYPAIISCVGLPVGLFWYAWTARPAISWASPAVAMIPFAWGNLCVFVSAIQYTADTYHGSVVASAVSANNFARYAFAGAFPLFTIQMYSALGVDWATSLLAFVSLALLPIPWILFKYGPTIRAKSRYNGGEYAKPAGRVQQSDA